MRYTDMSLDYRLKDITFPITLTKESTNKLLGKVKGNKMIDMQLSNDKLVNRGVIMLANELNIDQEKAAILLDKYKNVRTAINNYKNEH